MGRSIRGNIAPGANDTASSELERQVYQVGRMGLPDRRDLIGIHTSLARFSSLKSREQAVTRGKPDGMKRMFALDNSYVGDIFLVRHDGFSFPVQGVCHTRIFGWFVGQIEFCDDSQLLTTQAAPRHLTPRYVGKGRLTVVANPF